MIRLRYGLVAAITALAPSGLHAANDLAFTGPAAVDPAFADARQVELVDLDGDGDLDLVGRSGLLTAALAWWEQDGGTWTRHDLLPSAGILQSTDDLVVVDVDRDGDLDLVTASGTSAGADVLWWRNDGAAASWTSFAVTSAADGAAEVALGDVDGDGDPDVLVSVGASGTRWFANEIGGGTNADWTAHAVTTVVAQLGVADLDGDGDLDVLTAENAGDRIRWWDNGGDGTSWTERSLATSVLAPQAPSAADLDGDGDLDVLAADTTGDAIGWWENLGGTPLGWTPHAVADPVDGPRDVEAIDLDHDGDLDVLASLAFDDGVAWWENTAGDASAWARHDLPGTVDQPEWLATGDLDRDGQEDVVAPLWQEDRIVAWTGRRKDLSPTDWTANLIFRGVPFENLVAADFDRDGDLDLAGTTLVDSQGLGRWLNPGSQGASWTGIPHSVDPLIALGVGDVDGDGDADLVGIVGDTRELHWWENTAPTSDPWLFHSIGTATKAHSVATADFDRDGDVDVATIAEPGSGYGVTWWSNEAGDGTAWSDHLVQLTDGDGLTVADVDRDGDLDLVGGTEGPFGRLRVWTNPVAEADPAWGGTFPTTSSFADARATAVGDVDGDGHPDPVIADAASGRIVSWDADGGSATAWTEREIGTLPGATAVAVSDLDLDGDLDVVAIGETNGDLAWWRNDGSGDVWSIQPIDTGLQAPTALVAGDFDADGLVDLAFGETGSHGDSRLFLITAVAGTIFGDDFESGTTDAWIVP